ncbi:Kelch_1 domain-containing protein, partial [Cephalotus follicularis]
RSGAPKSVARFFFACAAVGPSKLYVVGGHDNQKNALKSAEAYDADANEWTTLPPMAEERDECQGLAWDGEARFWVVSGYGTKNQEEFRYDVEYYDPTTGSWSKVDEAWPFERTNPKGCTISVRVNSGCQWWWLLGVEGPLQQHGGLKEYEEKEKKWNVVSSIPLPNSIITGTSSCVTPLGFSGFSYSTSCLHV